MPFGPGVRRRIARAASNATITRGKRNATADRDVAQDLMKGRRSTEVRMLDSFFMLGCGLVFLGLIALLDPILLGWRSRRDALYVLVVAVGLIAAGWAARSI